MAPRKVEPIIDPEDEEDLDIEDDEDDVDESSTFELEELTEHHWHRRSVRDLIEMMSTPWLELNPDYQRDVVWTQDRMTKLINSLMASYYVPPIIFNVLKTKTETGAERYVRISIDGKQRLSSVKEFVAGTIPCTDKNGRKWYFCNNGDSSRSKKRILPERQKQKFMNLEFLCAEYSGLERKQEEDLFSRVQLGMPLTPAEKLKASSGSWQSFAAEIERTYTDLIEIVENRRARAFQLILQIFRQLMNADEENPKYNASANTIKAFCDRPQLLDESFMITARRVFHTYNEIAKKYPDVFKDHNYKHATKYSPIEFVGVAILIHQHPDRNAALLSNDILHLRAYLREERQDLRSNSVTFSTIMDFINNLEVHRGGAGVREAPESRTAQNVQSTNRAPVAPVAPVRRIPLPPTSTNNNYQNSDETSSPQLPPPELRAKIEPDKNTDAMGMGYLRSLPLSSSAAPSSSALVLPLKGLPATRPLASSQPQPQQFSSSSQAPVAPMARMNPADRFRAVSSNPAKWGHEAERSRKRTRLEGEPGAEEVQKIGPFSMDFS
ncbi:hypothetical protein RUND412_003391 [Rhizina undulata]